MTKARACALGIGLWASLLAGSCAERIEVGRDRISATAGNAGAETSGGSSAFGGANLALGGENEIAGRTENGGAPTHTCVPTACLGKIYQCGDCIDNEDQDGLIDSEDPECTGPCDNSEASFYGGIPGQNNSPCREDCYFDQDSGSGNDQCYWSHECDQKSVAPDYPPSGDAHCAYNPNANIPGSGSSCSGLEATQSATCLDYCLPLTPNGCDCFGCCELPAGSGKYVFIGSATQNVGTCDEAHLADPAACRPCTPVPSCMNHCDPCEVCVGRTTTSPSCPGSSASRCAGTAEACGQPSDPDCGEGYYCVTGCCVRAPR